jgi:hypothetical protein
MKIGTTYKCGKHILTLYDFNPVYNSTSNQIKFQKCFTHSIGSFSTIYEMPELKTTERTHSVTETVKISLNLDEKLLILFWRVF